MSSSPTAAGLDERLLAAKLREIADSLPGHNPSLRVLESFVRTASDQELVRINPIRFAATRGIDEANAIELFLHARRARLFTMEWQYVCPGCGSIATRFPSLDLARARYFCGICRADREADLSGFIEVSFTVSPSVRATLYHVPESLDAEAYLLSYRFTENGVVQDGSSLRDFYRRSAVIVAYVDPGATKAFCLSLEPGFLLLTDGPLIEVSGVLARRNDPIEITFRSDGAETEPEKILVAPGPLELSFTNATASRNALLGINVTDYPRIRLERFLSGSRLLSNQTFRDLFPSETLLGADGLTVNHIALLFTDIKGSTALYERVGDMKAFDLVRRHFGLLRDCIARNGGALVKTIGDAVMASFHEPLGALRAMLDMRQEIARFNEAAGETLLTLKMGAHAGTCLAVTLNGRLDYFGQAVNIAARIQRLAAPGEICISDALHRLSGAAPLLAACEVEAQAARLEGLEGEIRLHRIAPHRG
jgi:class 3 adenylate cyclase